MATKPKKKGVKKVKTVASNRLDSSQTTKKERKDPIVLGYDPNANFGDILKSWESTGELTGVTKRMKSHSKVEVKRSFGDILAEWEGEKKQPKQTEEPIKKSNPYKPTKDFGDLLDAFEGKQPAKKRPIPTQAKPVVPKPKGPMKPSKEMEEALLEKDELDAQRTVKAAWSFADTYRQWSEQTDEHQAIKESKKIKREEKRPELTISELRALLPEATLDLHGMTVVEAEQATTDFLHSSAAQKLRKIAIITGKGLHNDVGYSLLKEAALSQIRLSGLVREAHTPKARHGGSGVIWVILKS